MGIARITDPENVDTEDEVMRCQECEMVWADFADDEKTDRLDLEVNEAEHSLLQTGINHNSHTGHQTTPPVPGWFFHGGEFAVAECDTCEERWLFFDKSDAEGFKRNHKRHTGHSLTISIDEDSYTFKKAKLTISEHNPFGTVVEDASSGGPTYTTGGLPTEQALKSDAEESPS